jgi:hypothetical protein
MACRKGSVGSTSRQRTKEVRNMTHLNPAWDHAGTPRRAASLRRTVEWKLRGLWTALERHGQRRAASELARTARVISDTQPEVAAHLQTLARQWRAA